MIIIDNNTVNKNIKILTSNYIDLFQLNIICIIIYIKISKILKYIFNS